MSLLYRFVIAGFLLSINLVGFAGKDPVGWQRFISSGGTNFPASSAVGDNYSATYTLTNNLPYPVFLKPITKTTTGATFSFNDSCSNTTLAPQATCTVIVGFEATQSGTNSALLTINYHNNVVPLQPALSTTSSGSGGGGGSNGPYRALTLINSCSFPVWIGTIQSSYKGLTCTTNADCNSYAGVTPGALVCNSANGLCTWPAPVPQSGSYQLAASGTTTLQLPERIYYQYYGTPQQIPIIWSGSIFGRTGCTNGGTCQTADCGGGTGACTAGPVGQFTQAEMTLQAGATNDAYDLSRINGMNLPMSMGPSAPTTISTTNPYTCGTAGSTSAQTAGVSTIGACSWTFTLPSTSHLYTWVAPGGSSCPNSGTPTGCGGGTVCGLTTAAVTGGSTTTTCGAFLGYWTGEGVCKVNASFGAPYNCSSNISLFGCTGAYASSCYTSSNQTQCCGCVNWSNIPTDNSIVQQCGGTESGGTCSATGNNSCNDTWASDILPTLAWYKDGCPPSYVYPYDDKSSSFTCTNGTSTTSNSVDYTITFCPGGQTGAPSS